MTTRLRPSALPSRSTIVRGLGVALIAVLTTPLGAHADDDPGSSGPRLAGRAVLPAETLAPGPPAGAALVPAGQATTVVNGVQFPRPAQPVEGFSGIISGRRPGEYLAMPDNGFGGKANSRDFLARAYYVDPDFATVRHGTGTVEVGDHIQFADPDGLIGFPIVRESTEERWLTGGDIDPESIQRDHRGDLWVGDEFGPWILHFDASGRLREAPIALPDGLVSPNDPGRVGPPTVGNSRGIEAMAMTADGRHLLVVLEGAVPGDDPSSRRIYRYTTTTGEFTRLVDYRVESPGHFVADAQAIDAHRLLVLERDGGSGPTADFRRVYEADLAGTGTTSKELVVDLAAIPDPDLISLPALHDGDVGLGDPFRVACESVEALHVMSAARLLIGCDNNLPNTGRNPVRADDNELVVVKAPGR